MWFGCLISHELPSIRFESFWIDGGKSEKFETKNVDSICRRLRDWYWSDIRRSIRNECESNSSEVVGGYFNKACDYASDLWCQSYRPSLVCSLQGDLLTRKSNFYGILTGRIPVFFEMINKIIWNYRHNIDLKD